MLELSLGNVWAWAVQVAALAGAGVVMPSLLRMTSPGARLAHFRVLLLVCLTLPLLQPWVPGPAPAAPVATVMPIDLSAASGGQSVAGAPAASRPASTAAASGVFSPGRWPVEAWVGAAYLLGVAGRLFWLALGLVSLSRLRRSAVLLEPLPEPLEEAASLVGVRADFLVSPRVVRPVTFGLRRPVVLVPAGFGDFEPGQQTAVAAHELLHVARRDWLRTMADEVLLSVLWFHPVLWWLVEQIRLSTEQLIDREVVCLVGARRPYLEALLKLAAAGPTPMLQPASLFLKHGHLAQRVALLVREVSMSRLRLVSSFVVVLSLLTAGGWAVVQAFPLTAAFEAAVLPSSVPVAALFAQAPPPPPPPPPAPPSTMADVAQSAAGQQTAPTVPPKSQQLKPGLPVVPPPPPPPPPAPGEKGAGYVPPKPFDPVAWEHAVQDLTTRAAAAPTTAELQYTLGAYYWERVYRDEALTVSERRAFLTKGFQAIDQALALRPDYLEALIYKSLLLRSQATLETDPAKRQALVAEANKWRDQAITIRDAKNTWDAIPPNALKVGGGIAPPAKIKNVAPVYPPDAIAAKVSGAVIVEAVIGEDGKVRATRVLRSVPMLDAAAVEAISQWEFTPTLLNGVAVPVVMTATVNFRPKELQGVAGGVGGGVPGGVAGGVSGAAPPPPPPPPPPPAAEGKGLTDPSALKVGGGIKPPQKTVHVNPVYPPDAKQAKIQGVVIMDVLIGADGKVEQTKVLRSIPELDQAAVDAVRQWAFTPTLLNGVPQKVIMTVTVNFTLQ